MVLMWVTVAISAFEHNFVRARPTLTGNFCPPTTSREAIHLTNAAVQGLSWISLSIYINRKP